MFTLRMLLDFNLMPTPGGVWKKILKKVHRREKKFSENSFRKKEVVKEIYTKKKKSPAAAYRKSILCSLLKVLASHTHISGGGAQWILLLTVWTTNVHSLDKNYSLVASYCYDTMIKRRKMSRIVNTFKKKVISSDRQQKW
jgi:hypothetical protein